jgi:DNA-binding response OmpR family regulator
MATTVLIIEKDDPRVELLHWGLQQEGFDVVHATDPEHAAREEFRPEVIVLNTGMAADVKRIWITSLRLIVPGVRIVDLPGGPHGDDYDTGADGYLSDPIRLDHLQTLMTRILGHELEKNDTSGQSS